MFAGSCPWAQASHKKSRFSAESPRGHTVGSDRKVHEPEPRIGRLAFGAATNKLSPPTTSIRWLVKPCARHRLDVAAGGRINAAFRTFLGLGV